jgi:hypothetical protein
MDEGPEPDTLNGAAHEDARSHFERADPRR